MKITKCTSLFLALLILVSNVGMAFSVHFCGGKIAGISSNYNLEKKLSESVHQCCIKKLKENKSCCKDKIVKLNKKSDFTSKSFSFNADTAAVLVIEPKSTITLIPILGRRIVPSYHCDAHAPPLFKLYSQYIFYA